MDANDTPSNNNDDDDSAPTLANTQVITIIITITTRNQDARIEPSPNKHPTIHLNNSLAGSVGPIIPFEITL